LATTLGIAVSAHHVALVLVERRQTGTATLDQVLLDADVSTTTRSADASHRVLAEVEHIMAVLDAHSRPLSRVAVAAVEPAAAVTAVRLVQTLIEADLINARLVDFDPSPNLLARNHSGNPNLPARPIETLTTNAAMTAAHDIAVEEQALVPDASGRPPGGGRTRRNLAIAATALATVGIGLIGFRLSSGQAGPEIAPAESTDPAPAQVTQRATTPPSTTVADTITRVPATVSQAEVPAPSTPMPTSVPMPTQDSVPSSVETPIPQPPAEPPAPPPQAVEPPAPADQPLPEPVPPAPADPQVIQAPP
jgi:hypothetical protein